MTPLDALKAALEAKRQQRDQYGVGSSAYDRAYDNLDELLTDDTIAALIAVAEAADALVYRCTPEDVECCEGAVAGGDADCGKCTMHTAATALAPLVKEADDE